MDSGGQAAPGYHNAGPPQYWQGPPPSGAALPPGSQCNGAMPWSNQYRPPLPYSQVANNVEVGDSSDSQKLNYIIANMGTFENMVKHIQDLHNKLIVACEKIDGLQTQLVFSDQRTTKAEYRLIDLEARSHRNSMIFSGLPEQPDENNDMCEQTLVTFIKDEMQLGEAADNLVFQGVHSLGRIRRGVRAMGSHTNRGWPLPVPGTTKQETRALGMRKNLKVNPSVWNRFFHQKFMPPGVDCGLSIVMYVLKGGMQSLRIPHGWSLTVLFSGMNFQIDVIGLVVTLVSPALTNQTDLLTTHHNRLRVAVFPLISCHKACLALSLTATLSQGLPLPTPHTHT